MNQPDTPRMDRRRAIKWMLAAAAVLSVRDLPRVNGATPATAMPAVTAPGYGQDPDLMREYKAGELWPLTFTVAERRACAALCELIIPADEHSPSAVAVGVPDFIDEWISAPYPDQQRDRKTIVEGLAWLDAETHRRYQVDFAAASSAQKTELCDAICYEPKAAAEYKSAARFFARFRDLAASGFYTTPEGMKDAGYTGNMPMPSFDGPPPEALKQLGLI